MNRQAMIIAALIAVLLVVLFWMFLWRPQSDQIAELEAERESVEQQQVILRQRINRLEDVRREAPEIEAEIMTAESIVPREIAMAGALRQLQMAADDAGVELVSITPSRPAQVQDAEDGFAAIAVSLQVNGEYFELIDFLRRIEDPAITVRGVVWSTMSVSPMEHPVLSMNVSGSMFAVLPTANGIERAAPPPEAPDQPADDDEPADLDEPVDEDGDVEVEVED